MRRNMKRIICLLLCLLLAILSSGCTKKATVKNTIQGNVKTYSEMSDGTWMCDGHVYKYRLAIDGRMPTAARDSSFVYLSNIKSITFDRAYKAAGISSNTDDYFLPEEAVLVEMK